MSDRGGNGRNGDGTWPPTDGKGCEFCGATGGGGHGGGCPNMRAGHQAPAKRDACIVEREAAIVEVLRGGPMTTPDIAASIYESYRKPSRSRVMCVTQSLIVLERDGVVRRQPLLTGRRHWELAQ